MHLNYLVLKIIQVWVFTTLSDVLSSVRKKLKPWFRGPVLLKNGEPSLLGEGINSLHRLYWLGHASALQASEGGAFMLLIIRVQNVLKVVLLNAP